MQNGFIIIDRQIFTSEISEKPSSWFKIWLYLITNVQYEDYRRLKRGQGYFKYENIASLLLVTRSNIVEFMRRAKKQQMLTTQQCQRGLIVTIENYAMYQDQNKPETNLKQTGNKPKTNLYKEQDKQTKQDNITIEKIDEFKKLNKQEEEYTLSKEMIECCEYRFDLGRVYTDGLQGISKLTKRFVKTIETYIGRNEQGNLMMFKFKQEILDRNTYHSEKKTKITSFKRSFNGRVSKRFINKKQ